MMLTFALRLPHSHSISTMLNVLSLMWRRLTPMAGFWPPAK